MPEPNRQHCSLTSTDADAGFTLIELLVVIIIIAMLAAIAIPTYLSQREKAMDSAAMVLVRNALTVVQTAFVDSGSYSTLTEAQLGVLEPTITWTQSDVDLVTTTPAWVSNDITTLASLHQVTFYPESASVVDIATKSESGNIFGIQINTVTLGDTGYVKVKVIDGSGSKGW